MWSLFPYNGVDRAVVHVSSLLS